MQDVYMDSRVARPHSRDAPHSLFHSRECPRDIQVHDNFGVLKIYSFAQQVCRKEQINPLGWSRRWEVTCERSKAADRFMSCERAPGDSRAVRRKHRHTSRSGQAAK
jgi:hypothetical protein